MGLFSKSEPCPVCGGEVKGLFKTKIAGKKELCKDCSSRLSMSEELIKQATPEYIKEHLEYRKKNAQLFAQIQWQGVYTIFGDKWGVNADDRLIYITHDKLKDEDNPVIFSFDEITGYELFRLNKKVDDANEPGETAFETGMTLIGTLGRIAKDDNTNTDYFVIHITTTNPYWPELKLKITFSQDQLYGSGIFDHGFGPHLNAICQSLKRIVRKEPVKIFAVD